MKNEAEMSEQTGTQEAKVYRWSEIEPEQMNPLLTRQYCNGEQAMLARIMLKKGCLVPEHSHPNEQIAYIVSGAMEFVVAGVSHIIRTGDILVIPANVRHSALALEDTEDLDIFAPPRHDWINNDDAYLRQK
jgi:quercetin dioxygenase-like cupin family protein